jgi:hypothetical protein
MVKLLGGKRQEGTEIRLRSIHRAAAPRLTLDLRKVDTSTRSRERDPGPCQHRQNDNDFQTPETAGFGDRSVPEL